MAKKKRKKAAKKKATKKNSKKSTKKNTRPKKKKAAAKKPPAPKKDAKPKLVVMQHKRLRRTGREMRGYRCFRGFIEVPENQPRHIRLFRKFGYDIVPASHLADARNEANDRAAYLLKHQQAGSKAEAARLAATRAQPGRVLTERDRIANQAREASTKFNAELRRLTNTLQKAMASAQAFMKRSGDDKFTEKNAKVVAAAEAAIAKLRAKANPEVRGRRATANEEARRAKEQDKVVAVRSAEGHRADRLAKLKERALVEKAKKEARDRAKTKKDQEAAAKAAKDTGPEAKSRKATADLEARREAEEKSAEETRQKKADEVALALKKAEKKKQDA